MSSKKDNERKFTFCLDDMIANNIQQKKEVTFRSLSRYLSISDEAKQKLIEDAISTAPPSSFSDRTKKKRKRLA